MYMKDYGDDTGDRDQPIAPGTNGARSLEESVALTQLPVQAKTDLRGVASPTDSFVIDALSKEAGNGAAPTIGPPSIPKEVSVVRDTLAHHRTVLANERTLLASVRTALTLFVAGVSFVTFFGVLAVEVVGWIFLPIAAVILLLAIARYRKIGNRLTLELEVDGSGGSGSSGRGGLSH